MFGIDKPYLPEQCGGYIHCGTNESLFLAIAALRENTDKFQWFTDAVIRLLDLCGLREIKLENDCLDDEVLEEYSHIFIGKTFTESIFNITKNLIDRDISYSLIKIFGLAKHLDIDLLWHIEQKQRYNELIPYKHGKKY